MGRFVFVPVLTVAALLLTVSLARASESDELRERAQAVKKEAAELAKAGRGEEAEKLARKANELLEAAERLEGKGPKGLRPEFEKLRGLFKNLVEKERQMKELGAPEKEMAEIRERIAKAKEELARSGLHWRFEGPKEPRPFGPPASEAMAKLEETGRRIKHFRTAAENLREAGANEIAKELMEKAEHMEREAREAKMRLAKEGEHRPGPKMGPLPMMQFQEMRAEIERLRGELNELRQRVKELEQRR